jgi:hypothetical protein
MTRLWARKIAFVALLTIAVTSPVSAQMPQIPQIPGNIQVGVPATPTIILPKAGALVKSPILVKGTTTKDAKVKVTATIAATTIPVSGLSRQLGNAQTTADAKGVWQVSIAYTIPLKVSGVKIIIEAVAVNALTGQASGAAKVEVVPKM